MDRPSSIFLSDSNGAEFGRGWLHYWVFWHLVWLSLSGIVPRISESWVDVEDVPGATVQYFRPHPHGSPGRKLADQSFGPRRRFFGGPRVHCHPARVFIPTPSDAKRTRTHIGMERANGTIRRIQDIADARRTRKGQNTTRSHRTTTPKKKTPSLPTTTATNPVYHGTTDGRTKARSTTPSHRRTTTHPVYLHAACAHDHAPERIPQPESTTFVVAGASAASTPNSSSSNRSITYGTRPPSREWLYHHRPGK